MENISSSQLVKEMFLPFAKLVNLIATDGEIIEGFSYSR
jgi:hypothetical protein